jgi:hypothetical protein
MMALSMISNDFVSTFDHMSGIVLLFELTLDRDMASA